MIQLHKINFCGRLASFVFLVFCRDFNYLEIAMLHLGEVANLSNFG